MNETPTKRELTEEEIEELSAANHLLAHEIGILEEFIADGPESPDLIGVLGKEGLRPAREELKELRAQQKALLG